MKKSEFYFDLPEELIAQTPLKDRKQSRLLAVSKTKEEFSHDYFYNLKDYLRAGDVLVLNNTQVIPARLYGDKVATGAKVELLLLEELEKDIWKTLVGNARVVKEGVEIWIANGLIKAECLEVLEGGMRTFKMTYEGVFLEVLAEIGEMPLPPYIHERLEDQNRYQTVYAKHQGSAAAPTAGLHFTQELLKELEAMGVIIEYVTLHVGLGTFLPMNVDELSDHVMHEERYFMSATCAKSLNKAKEAGNRIVAVGTTSGRTLETIYQKYDGEFNEDSGTTSIFIYPGIKVDSFDMMVTNFHLPESTLIMFVSALLGKERTLAIYQEAIKEKYRFFSFGDAMIIYE